ncbi:MAG: sodium-dependent transporter, partial [Planctomycetota bacterium]
MEEQRGQWGSRLGFILAATGSAIGLGNIWKFPYITGENGGGLFVLIYLVCIGLVGIPIMMAEIMIGRAAEKQPVEAFHTLQGRRTAWAGVGWLGVLAGFVILSYYAVVAGWAMDYTLKSVANFTTPINEMAEQEAVTYRATASLDDMRAGLIERHTERDAKPRPAARMRRKAGCSRSRRCARRWRRSSPGWPRLRPSRTPSARRSPPAMLSCRTPRFETRRRRASCARS